jgi:hypothetical protein
MNRPPEVCAREVLDIGGVHQSAAMAVPFEDQRSQISAGSVHRRRVARRTDPTMITLP